MPRRRTFTATPSVAEPVVFDLEYVRVGTDDDGERVEKKETTTFRCVGEPPGAVLLDLAGSAVDETGARSAAAVLDFFRAVLVDDDVAPFFTLVHDKAVAVPIATLGEIMNWLAEEYGRRPTGPSSSSQDGRSTTGATSTGSSFEPGSTPSS